MGGKQGTFLLHIDSCLYEHFADVVSGSFQRKEWLKSDVRPEISGSLKAFYDEQRAPEFDFTHGALPPFQVSTKVTLVPVLGPYLKRERNRKELNYNGVDIERFGR